MTRKDFVLLAAALHRARPDFSSVARDTWLVTVSSVCDALGRTNPRFDAARFLAASGASE